MFLQDDIFEYSRSFCYEIFMSNITKLIPTNIREGNKGTSEKLPPSVFSVLSSDTRPRSVLSIVNDHQ